MDLSPAPPVVEVVAALVAELVAGWQLNKHNLLQISNEKSIVEHVPSMIYLGIHITPPHLTVKFHIDDIILNVKRRTGLMR